MGWRHISEEEETVMAKPIPATPPVSGADAKALLESLERPASREEMARRIAGAKQRLKSTPEGSAVYVAVPQADARRR